MNHASLEALFVGRHDVMKDVLSRVTTSTQTSQKHYMLLVGPRGSGKTHLLVLAYHRLMAVFDADDCADRVAIALLKEEEWGVASYLDLVVRILKALAEQTPQLNAEIDAIYSKYSKDPVDAEALAVRLLRQHSHGKTLLLLCENLMDLFHGLGDEGQKRWRAAIPLGMLHAAVKYSKSGDERQLLKLPLEQRQLLEEVLPGSGGGGSGEVEGSGGSARRAARQWSGGRGKCRWSRDRGR